MRDFSIGSLGSFIFFFLKDPPPPEIYPLPLHDALPIGADAGREPAGPSARHLLGEDGVGHVAPALPAVLLLELQPEEAQLGAALEDGVREPARLLRSEEHTSELQSQSNLVCRLLLEKTK